MSHQHGVRRNPGWAVVVRDQPVTACRPDHLRSSAAIRLRQASREDLGELFGGFRVPPPSCHRCERVVCGLGEAYLGELLGVCGDGLDSERFKQLVWEVAKVVGTIVGAPTWTARARDGGGPRRTGRRFRNSGYLPLAPREGAGMLR